MHSFFKKYRVIISWVGIGILLFTAACMRLYKISEYMTFLGDEGRDVLIVKHMIVNHQLTLLGPTASVGGFFMGPIYYYFMAPFLWLFKLDPTGPAIMVALFGIATVYMVYKVGKEFFSDYVGYIAASLYAISPIIIAYSRSSWNPNLVPFFAMVTVYFLWRVVAKNEWRHLFWIGLSVGIGLQLHYLFLFLILTAGVWFLLEGRSKKHISHYVLGIVGFLVGYSLFLAFEVRHGFPNTISIFRFITEGKGTGFDVMMFFHTITEVLFRVFGRLVLRLPEGGFWNNYPSWQITSWIAGTNLSIAVSIFCIGIVLFLYRTKKRLRFLHIEIGKDVYVATKLFAVWLAVPLILFGLYQKAIYDYYFGIFFPLPFLLIGVVIWLLSKIRYGYIFSIFLWGGLLYLNWVGRPFIYTPNNQLAQTKAIAQAAFDKTGGKPFNFALIADRNSDHAFRYFFEIWGNPPVVLENEQKDPERKTITDQLIVLCDNPNCQPLGHPLWEIAGFGRAEIVGSWDVPFVRIFKLVHYKESDAQ